MTLIGHTGATALTTRDRDIRSGIDQIWLDDVNCRGTESRLIDCPARAIGSHNCGHHEDAGVSCQPGEIKICYYL